MRMRRARRHAWQLSFASMSDIAFLLIIFFAVAGKFAKSTDKQVALPVADLSEAGAPRDIDVVVTKEGEFFVNGSRVEADGLKDEIQSYLFEDADPESRTVVLSADRDAEYGRVAQAVEAINQADAYLELAVKHAE